MINLINSLQSLSENPLKPYKQMREHKVVHWPAWDRQIHWVMAQCIYIGWVLTCFFKLGFFAQLRSQTMQSPSQDPIEPYKHMLSIRWFTGGHEIGNYTTIWFYVCRMLTCFFKLFSFTQVKSQTSQCFSTTALRLCWDNANTIVYESMCVDCWHVSSYWFSLHKWKHKHCNASLQRP